MTDDKEARAAAFAFADQASDWLERIYEAAHGPLKLGKPVLVIPRDKILTAEKFGGVVFVDLHLVIELIRDGLLPRDQQQSESERGG
jgi:hypothetical protein